VTSHDATFYIQVLPEFGRFAVNGKRPVTGIKPVTMTQKAPSRPQGGTVLVKLTLRIPDSAFYPLRPEAVIVVPEDMVEINPVVDVVVSDPREDADETPLA
jgi:hypothetical protein